MRGEKVIRLSVAIINDSKGFVMGWYESEWITVYTTRAASEQARVRKPCQDMSCQSILAALKDDDGE